LHLIAKHTIKQRVDEFLKSNKAEGKLMLMDMNEIKELGNMVDIIMYAFYFGYMEGQKAKKGGADDK